jgi:predicted N-acetyltransferase YhbS
VKSALTENAFSPGDEQDSVHAGVAQGENVDLSAVANCCNYGVIMKIVPLLLTPPPKAVP